MAARNNRGRNSIAGELIRISPDNRNVLAFVSYNNANKFCSNALVLIPGLTDGMMGLAYTHALNEGVLKIDYSLVQVNLSTSFYQFGLHTLDTDVNELTEIVEYLDTELKFNNIVLLGHSTGCQDILYFLRHSRAAGMAKGIILQGAVSDRDDLGSDKNSPALLEEALKLTEEGQETDLLSGYHSGAPITAKRYLSLGGRLTPDDMFSNDLSSADMVPILSPVKVPTLLCFSEQDEYVPDISAQKATSQRMVDTLLSLGNTTVVQRVYLNGDHGLSLEKYYVPFVDLVVDFVNKNFT